MARDHCHLYYLVSTSKFPKEMVNVGEERGLSVNTEAVYDSDAWFL